MDAQHRVACGDVHRRWSALREVPYVDWALPIAAEAGFAGIVVGCEPTGHRWKPALERCRARGVEVVCVNPMLVHRGREEEDFTRDRSDFKDSTIIARRVADRHCYIPYALEGDWCRLRHLGARRNDQLVEATAARQQLRDPLESVWPAVLATAAQPLRSTTWRGGRWRCPATRPRSS